jgi:hypothetical protein
VEKTGVFNGRDVFQMGVCRYLSAFHVANLHKKNVMTKFFLSLALLHGLDALVWGLFGRYSLCGKGKRSD